VVTDGQLRLAPGFKSRSPPMFPGGTGGKAEEDRSEHISELFIRRLSQPRS